MGERMWRACLLAPALFACVSAFPTTGGRASGDLNAPGPLAQRKNVSKSSSADAGRVPKLAFRKNVSKSSRLNGSSADAARVPKLAFELEPYDPVAEATATVIAGRARFTVLTPRLLRLEYSVDGVFEDRPTLAFVNRKLPVPPFTWNGSHLTTSSLQLQYTGGEFTPSSLSVKPVSSSAFQGWSFGQTSAADKGNLRGTFRTLDQTENVTLDCSISEPAAHCEWGVISRSGWALVNETGVPCLDEADWWADAQGKMLRNRDVHDLYLFAHGHDYEDALADLTAAGGKIPMMPRRNAGVWFTRWYDYAAPDVIDLVDEFEQRSLPLDVLVLDMNWHKKNGPWAGYSWDRTLYPEPRDLTSYLHGKGLSIAANLHDADGVGPFEDAYAPVAAAMGQHDGQTVPFTLVNRTYVNALEDLVLRPIEQDGMDFWWIDWQQGESQGGTGQDGRPDGKMNPTIWTAKTRVTDSMRRCRTGLGCSNRRGVTFARWGGLGQHRYQHGFSGDVRALTWPNLAYQAYFSATASNVGFGFWSHDVEGPGSDHEMYARWLQLAAYSGILRMHDRGMSAGSCMPWPSSFDGCSTVRPWNVPLPYYQANAAALRTRAALLPYVYTQFRRAHDTGVGIMRPLYYAYPELSAAYPESADAMLGQTPGSGQYLFGPDLMVAPVTAPAPCVNGHRLSVSPSKTGPCGLTPMSVWVPPGTWTELHTGHVLSGPLMLARNVHLLDVPTYARAGAVVPRRPVDPARSSVGVAAASYTALEWSLYPGADAGLGECYEDDGESYDYLQGSSAWTRLAYKYASPTVLSVTISAPAGSFATLPSARAHSLRIVNVSPASLVTLVVGSSDAKPLTWSRRGGSGSGSWSYDGREMTLVIDLPQTNVQTPITINVTLAAPAPAPHDSPDLNTKGVKGVIAAARRAKAALDQRGDLLAPGSHRPDPAGSPLSVLGGAGEHLSFLAGQDASAFASTFGRLLTSLPALYSAALAELRALETNATQVADTARAHYAVAILQAAQLA